jgi:hypothetical protein
MTAITPRPSISTNLLNKLAVENTGPSVDDGPSNDDFADIDNAHLADNGEFLVGTIGNQIAFMGGLKRESKSSVELMRMRVHTDHQHKV